MMEQQQSHEQYMIDKLALENAQLRIANYDLMYQSEQLQKKIREIASKDKKGGKNE